ncbi:exosortase/archaeosortase family protein [Candidatus Micrarchaeota archaeon]|nr:exosortase/archaeosortase family protein [Candidatus Micrarchaeota archaeon]
MNRALGFVLKFFAIFLVLEAGLFSFGAAPLEEWIAGFEAQALGLESAGNVVIAGGNEFTINESCTGLVSGIILASIVFALRRPALREKLKIFTAGFVFLFPLNLLRVYFVLLSAQWRGAETAEFVHIASWFMGAGFVLLFWYFLTKRFAGVKEFNELI